MKVDKIICKDNLLNLSDIMRKINDLSYCCNEMETCCNILQHGEVIRGIIVGDRVFLTNDGSAPKEVPYGGGDPIQTYSNTKLMDKIVFNKVVLRQMYMNGIIVFEAVLRITLPQYTSKINLKEFIDSKNVNNYRKVIVTNNLIQPILTTGNLNSLDVTLINNGEFQGFSSGGNAFEITSSLFLDNSNGWIRGAGGDGGNGGGIDLSGIPSSVGVWGFSVGHDDGRYVSGSAGSPCAGTSNTAHFNRFWKTAGGANSGAWINSTCADNLQEYWNTATAPVWGDQGRCHTVKQNFKLRHGGGINLQGVKSAAISVSGGTAGVGGTGQGFRQVRNEGKTNGKPGSYSGPSSGFNESTGKDYNLPSSSGVIVNGNGGNGGAWAVAGSAGTNGGTAGSPAGKAMTGSGLLVTGSDIGNTNGVVS